MKSKLIYFFLSLAMMTTVTYFIYSLINSARLVNQITTIISISVMAVFAILFVVMSMNNSNTKLNKYIVFGSLLLTFYSGFNTLANSNALKLPTQNSVINFTNKTVTEAIIWAKRNNIKIEQIYENSDNYEVYKIISQSVVPGTLVKRIDKLTVTVSSGPNLNKEVMIPSFIGWSFSEVISFIDLNYLSNVVINFEVSSNFKDTVITQVGSGYLKRSDLIKINFSIGTKENIVPKEIEDFSGKSLFYATTWLKRFGFSYDLGYQYNYDISKDHVISQSINGKVADPNIDKINLNISKGAKIKIVNLLKMDVEQITDWIIKNNLNVFFDDAYDDNVKLGYPINVNYKEGYEVEEGTTIKVLISRGQIKMPKLKTVNEFINWAIKYNIKYEEVYEFNDKINNGEVIKISHQENDVIKIDDTVTIYVSQGTPVIVPNFIGMNKNIIQTKCNDVGINCNFIYGGLTESTAKDTALNQSKTKGTQIVKDTSISITLSSGIYVKVTVPNFVGMTKTQVNNTCKSLKITCNFFYQGNFSSVPKDQAVSQSKSGIMNQGSTISIVLSKGAARVYTVIIDGSLLSNGNPQLTKTTLQSKLSAVCSGVTFIYSFKSVMTGIGYLNPSSDVKVGSNTLIEGNTYKIIINSN